MAQEIWFRTDLKHVIEGLALSLVCTQSCSETPSSAAYERGFLSALASLGTSLGITNIEIGHPDQIIWTVRPSRMDHEADRTVLIDKTMRG